MGIAPEDVGRMHRAITEHSIVHGLRKDISDADCGDGQRANVEILGWLYQFYISERKDQVMACKSAVSAEDRGQNEPAVPAFAGRAVCAQLSQRRRSGI
jgi:hypothetical protein